MANFDPEDMIARLTEIEKEIVSSDVFPDRLRKGEAFPYWTNYMPNLALNRGQNNFGEEATEAAITINATLAIGTMTGGNPGEREADFMRLAFDAARYFNARPKLQSAVYPEGQPFVHFMECTNVARSSGEGGAGSPVLLGVFTLVIHLFEPLHYAYF